MASLSLSPRTAHHEAGHLVAAAIRDISWTIATIRPEGPLADTHLGYVVFDRRLDPADEAFIFWAGPYAESRFAKEPLAKVCASDSARDDMSHFSHLRTPRRDRDWAAELDPYWPAIRDTAARLLISGTLHPDHPDPIANLLTVLAQTSRNLDTAGGGAA